MNADATNPSETPGNATPPIAVDDHGPDIVSDTSGADPAPDIVALLRKAEDEAAAMREAFLRARADVENVRRQAQADVAKAHKYGIERFAESLLPVRDALETALGTDAASAENLRAGVELTLKQLASAFDKARLVAIDPLGEKFDPHVHQAMAMIDSDQPANTVVQVMQKGYRLNDRVVRPAMVLVSNGGRSAAT